MSDSALLDAVALELGEAVGAAVPVGGGSINDAWRVETKSGATVFVKSRIGAAPAEFQAEAAGLRWLAAAATVSVPRVLATGAEPPPSSPLTGIGGVNPELGGPGWIALEWIEPGALARAGAEELGRGLAALHRAGAGGHGVLPPGSPDTALRLGSVELEIGLRESFSELYAEQMLTPLTRRARDSGSLASGDAAAVEAVCARIDELAGPAEPPARLHGDLWGGNVLSGATGTAWLIDPAAYGGHREVDLAMLRLFGSPGESLFAAYDETHPLADGHAERIRLWQLLPLLVHALLFGGSYGAAAGQAARAYL